MHRLARGPLQGGLHREAVLSFPLWRLPATAACRTDAASWRKTCHCSLWNRRDVVAEEPLPLHLMRCLICGVLLVESLLIERLQAHFTHPGIQDLLGTVGGRANLCGHPCTGK